jgi:hypothetical protein
MRLRRRFFEGEKIPLYVIPLATPLWILVSKGHLPHTRSKVEMMLRLMNRGFGLRSKRPILEC